MVSPQFKQAAVRVILGASLLGAGILGVRCLYGLYLWRQFIPEETVFIPAPRGRILLSLLTDIVPILLYLGALLLAKSEAWSRFGRAVGACQLLYGIVLVAAWNSEQSLVQKFH